jgi:hypothetical protein
MTFGTGTPLRQLSPVLRDPQQRRRLILDRVERDSVIEGLPRFDDSIRGACLREMEGVSA